MNPRLDSPNTFSTLSLRLDSHKSLSTFCITLDGPTYALARLDGPKTFSTLNISLVGPNYRVGHKKEPEVTECNLINYRQFSIIHISIYSEINRLLCLQASLKLHCWQRFKFEMSTMLIIACYHT